MNDQNKCTNDVGPHSSSFLHWNFNLTLKVACKRRNLISKLLPHIFNHVVQVEFKSEANRFKNTPFLIKQRFEFRSKLKLCSRKRYRLWFYFDRKYGRKLYASYCLQREWTFFLTKIFHSPCFPLFQMLWRINHNLHISSIIINYRPYGQGLLIRNENTGNSWFQTTNGV